MNSEMLIIAKFVSKAVSKESSEKHLVSLDFFNQPFLFIYELGIGVYIHMKHSVLVQFIRWLCVQIRPKTDNEQLVCNFFSQMFSTTSCHSPVMFIMARKFLYSLGFLWILLLLVSFMSNSLMSKHHTSRSELNKWSFGTWVVKIGYLLSSLLL